MSESIKSSAVFPTAAERQKRLLSTSKVAVLVIAAAAPLAAMIGNMPLATSLPAGLAMPAVYVLVSLALSCFAAGYTSLGKEIKGGGAFYTYVGQGLGKHAGVMAAYAAVLAYGAYAIGSAAAFGYFASLITRELGHQVSWLWCSAAGIALIGLLGYRSLDLSARVLVYFMTAEFGVLIAFDVLVLASKGLAALPMDIWHTASVMRPEIGAIVPFVIVSFVGFEAVALYGEETADPRRSVPRATFAALGLIAAFYMVSAWIVIGAAGTTEVGALAKRESGHMLFALAHTYGGPVLTAALGVLLVASLLASFLALHNAASRYCFALASDHLLPPRFAQYHPNHHSPHVASVVMTALECLVVLGFGLYGVEPYIGIASSTIGFGTIGIIGMQCACSLAVVGFFGRTQRKRMLTTQVLPLIGAATLALFLALVVTSYPTLTGTDNPIVNGLPLVLIPLVLCALGYAEWLKRKRPAIYAQIASTEYRHNPNRTAAVVNRYKSRYCIIGAGPSGLITARAFLKEGIPFDCFERHADVGGLWDPENPGTPIYESAHFISSKWTSYFYGFPMPESYPDYPSYRQILNYIRSFARAFGLYEHITFNTAVVSAGPDGDGWRVTLSNGETRQYAGVIACPGVTWHPSLPKIRGSELFKGEIRHTVSYSKADEFKGKTVLVVGAGNSGVDIACDAARAADKTFFSVRRGYRFVPKYLFGIPTDVLMSGKALPPKGIALTGDANKMLDTINGDLTRLGLPKPDHDALASHPIMNTQILHYISHGDIAPKPDVAEFRELTVVFKDGTEEMVDLVMFATGYEYKMPFFDPAMFEWKSGRPQLYLNVVHRNYRGLYVLGFTEFSDAAYRRFDEMAQIIVADIHATETADGRAWLDEQRRSHFPDMRGGKTYVNSPRHANYVHMATYQKLLAEFRRKLGWPDLSDDSYSGQRKRETGHRAKAGEGTFFPPGSFTSMKLTSPMKPSK